VQGILGSHSQSQRKKKWALQKTVNRETKSWGPGRGGAQQEGDGPHIRPKKDWKDVHIELIAF